MSTFLIQRCRGVSSVANGVWAENFKRREWQVLYKERDDKTTRGTSRLSPMLLLKNSCTLIIHNNLICTENEPFLAWTSLHNSHHTWAGPSPLSCQPTGFSRFSLDIMHVQRGGANSRQEREISHHLSCRLQMVWDKRKHSQKQINDI